jgi:ABC-2 type transport system ATP-binding protein
VLIDGVSIHSPGIEAVRRRIGHVPEQPILYDYLTGREFVQFVGRLYETDGDLDAWLEPRLVALQMSEGADRLIKTYSMGMRKKIAFLAALVHRPNVLIFDEPTGSLDAVSARIVKDEMQAARGEGSAVLFTTHVMEIAERLSDRVAILTAGRLIAEGSFDDLRATHGRHARESLEDLFLRLTREETEPEPGR